MKLTYAATSPFARKLHICAIELGLIGRIELVPTSATPGTFNEAYSRDVSPLRKLPALILDDGTSIVDSYVIAEYFDDLAGGGKLIPASGAKKWQVKTEHSITQGMLDAMLLCRYEKVLRPEALRWQTWIDDQWDRVWHGLQRFEAHSDILTRPLDVAQIGLVCVLGYADLRFADCGWRKAFPKLDAFHNRMMERESVRISVPPA